MRRGMFAVSPKMHVKMALEVNSGMCSQLFTVPDADNRAMWR